MASNQRQSRFGVRDNRTGEFRTKREGDRNPAGTSRVHIPLPGYGDTGRYDKDKPKGK